MNDIWRRVTADFDFMVDAPGAVSDRAMDALLSFLGIEVTMPPQEYDWWAKRVSAAATAEPDRLLAALSTPDLSRIAAFMLSYSADPGPLDDVVTDDEPTRLAMHIAAGVHHGWAPGDDLASFGRAFGATLASRPVEPDMIAALMLCTGAPGATLAELPWAEPGWDDPVSTVDGLLIRAPAAHVEWLRSMAAHHPAEVPSLADSAERTCDTTLVEAYGIALLAHEDVSVRRAAVGRLSRRWHTDAYQDAVAALLTDPAVADAAVDRLTRIEDRRALPYLIERVGRADDTARAWLGGIGDAAAVPVLRALLTETGEPGLARPAAAEAYWRITGDADLALSIVEPLTSEPGDLGVRARAVADRVRAQRRDGDQEGQAAAGAAD